jgi:hypothetical protein
MAARIVGACVTQSRLYCFLSDRRTFSVHFAVSPLLASATRRERLDWQVAEEGRALVWQQRTFAERLYLDQLLSDPSVQHDDLPPLMS